LLHEGHWVVGEKRELLVLGHGIISSTEKILGDFTITEWLREPPGWRVTVNADDSSEGLAS
jgi:hypothetical protein